MKYGYYLITDPIMDQEAIDMLNKKVDKLFPDYEYSDNKYQKREELLSEIGLNDTLIVYELSHLAATLNEFFELKDELIKKSITLISNLEKIDTSKSDLDQEYVLKVMIDLESKLKSKRTGIGLKKARKDGIKGGRSNGIPTKYLEKAKEAARLWEQKVDINEIVRITGVPRSSVYRYTEILGVRRTKKREK